MSCLNLKFRVKRLLLDRPAGRLALMSLVVLTIGTVLIDAKAQTNKPIPPKLSDNPDIAQMSIEDLMKVKMETVFGASKFLQKVTEAPASVTIVTAEDIKRYGYRTLADILNGVRGFYVSNDRNYTYLGTRGLARPGDYNTRVLLMINGHRMNDGVYDSAYIGTEAAIDVDIIDRVEIIRGPSSSLYGASAFFAVINVFTKRGAELNGVEVASSFSSLDTVSGRFSYGKRYKAGAELLLSASAYNSEGHNRLYFPAFDTPATNNGIAERADADGFKSLFGDFSWKEFSLQGFYGTRRKHVPTGSYGTVFNSPDNYTADSHSYVDLKFDHQLKDGGSVVGRVYFDRYYYRGDYIYEQDGVNVVNRDLGIGSWGGAEFNYQRKVFRKHRVTLGTEYRNDFQQDQDNFDVTLNPSNAVYVSVHRNSNTSALFAQDEFSIKPNLLLNIGIRYDRYSTFGGTTNPRVGIVYSPLKKTTVKLLYGQAFRPPNSHELYFGGEGGTVKNSRLRPETIRTVEAVLEQYVGDHLRFSASGFTYRLHGLISQIIDPVDGLPVFENSEKLRSHGAEFEAEVKTRQGIDAKGSYTFARTENAQTGLSLTNSPRHQAKLNISFPIAPRRVFAGFDLQYLSSRLTLQGAQAPGFVTSNVTLFGKRLYKGAALSLSVYNFLNEKYADPCAEEHLQDMIRQDGRSLRLKFTYSFGKPE